MTAAWHIIEAQFVATYGAEMLRYRGELTSDGYIPWKLFMLLVSALPAVWARQAMNEVRALSIGVISPLFGSASEQRWRLEQLGKEAFGA